MDLKLPRERVWPFRALRQGLPLLLGFSALAYALLEPAFAFGCGLLVFLSLIEVAPSFLSPKKSIQYRRFLIRWDGLWVRAFLPVMRFFKLEEPWVLSFCAWNNLKVAAHFRLHPSPKALLLLPHCIQIASCKWDVVHDLQSCKQCGRCSVGDCLALGLDYAWEMCLSNRSHKAYREARAFQPELVVAVSCWSRLLKGLLKLPEVPCYVIPLRLPHGMCVDTTFDVTHLQAAMAVLTRGKSG